MRGAPVSPEESCSKEDGGSGDRRRPSAAPWRISRGVPRPDAVRPAMLDRVGNPYPPCVGLDSTEPEAVVVKAGAAIRLEIADLGARQQQVPGGLGNRQPTPLASLAEGRTRSPANTNNRLRTVHRRVHR